MKNKKVFFQDWGLIDYQQAWDKQEELFSASVKTKLNNRNSELAYEAAAKTLVPADTFEPFTPDEVFNYLVFCEHPHVYTLGKSGKPEHLLLDEQGLKDKHAVYYTINRGGDITYHGPGQIVSYPILDLDNFFTDIHLYLRKLEEAVILTLADYGLQAGRYPGYTGVWFDADNEKARKICAMGVRCSRWVTMHGLAFNINTDLDYFNNIVPCGIDDKAVTSMQKELGKEVDINEVKKILKHHISVLFGMEIL
ncbi:lipoyl(octanoyl) transferase LipB [Mucilaginibacter aquaedulcis]|jgi:lipoyl(octanoyl) transferase|uniref:lipoyl(octanoyl) transferase LipB n=1 Tax=Mucilaginibacter aquaedulcis TaxID=1187081 RepID=UPI0025B5F386|nr:lipoyl(octanoyl) transferase LipB [Mucilaginibacter aquaedulcis]MDN3551843.1 lipoyl(octanoyl) transferase LipB [Mucilaginibacter aquaedulcis]